MNPNARPAGVDMRLNKAMPESKSATISRLQREADTAEKRGKELARDALLTTDARRRRRMASMLRRCL
jgi:hypothetical protein